jgi:phosphoglycerate dehydrogenase-like enzyme
MNILFAASENAFGGIFHILRSKMPEHRFGSTGEFRIKDLTGVDVLIPTMSPVTVEVLNTADRLKLIQQCGAGLEMVDIESALRKGIQVANVPTDISGNADSVAELGIFLMVGLSRNFKQMKANLQNRKMGQPRGNALYGKTVGIVGLGGIGKALILRLKPFGVRLIGLKRHGIEEAKEELGLDWAGKPEDLNTLLQKSDYVVLCLPCTFETRHMIRSETISHMKREAFLINLARGGLIEKNALREALAKGKIAGAGLDVYWKEPPDPNDQIFDYNVLATPHIAGSTDISLEGIVHEVMENINRLEKNLTLRYLKNK